MSELIDPLPNWRSVWRAQARAHPHTALGLSVGALAVLLLSGASLYRAAVGEIDGVLRLALLGGAAGFLATALGALPALGLNRLSSRWEDTLLGLAAGMMLAASSFSLILPGLAAGEQVMGHAASGAALVVLGLALGAALMLGLDDFMPHEHLHLGVHGAGGNRISRLWLFVFAIALHNLPEGMAIGVAFSRGDLSVGLPLTSAIALQDIPEGLAVAMALKAAGLAPLRAMWVAVASGIMEPLGALVGVGLTSGLAAAYPIGLGLAAGAMIFVVFHEVIPETHRNGHQTAATLGLMAGFAVMMVLDTTLG
ncbi:ZIP family metal transporter [Thiobacter aerophilum]|uniref:ZIP family metal transporter n=1 Tax=Thiobacter aerophilum TaxID=3121275 RepID=A0ABV0EFH0_9BURK